VFQATAAASISILATSTSCWLLGAEHRNLSIVWHGVSTWSLTSH